MPKYDLSTPILNDKGQPHKEGEEVITTGSLARRALLMDYQPGGGVVPGVEKAKRFKLWKRLSDEKNDAEVELTPEEAVLIKQCAEPLSTFAYGQLVQLLDG